MLFSPCCCIRFISYVAGLSAFLCSRFLLALPQIHQRLWHANQRPRILTKRLARGTATANAICCSLVNGEPLEIGDTVVEDGILDVLLVEDGRLEVLVMRIIVVEGKRFVIGGEVTLELEVIPVEPGDEMEFEIVAEAVVTTVRLARAAELEGTVAELAEVVVVLPVFVAVINNLIVVDAGPQI